MNVTRIVIPYMKEDEGIIINISSDAGKVGYGEIVPYCASKFGVRGFTKALALELPDNIKIYVVNPGLTATQMTNFQGTHPKKVAGIVVDTAKENLDKKSGDDIDIEDYL